MSDAAASGAAEGGAAPEVPKGYQVLKEGLGSILKKGNDVFYNEAQVTNRDMSIAVLRHFLPILASEKQQGMYKPPKGARQKLREREQGGGRAPATADGGESSAAAAVGEGAAAAAGEGTAVVEAGAGSKAQGGEGAEASGSGDAKAGPSGAQARPPGKGALVLEGLAATGLRSIRYALEVPGIARIDANDLDPSVVESMKRNVQFNGPQVQGLVHAVCSDARMIMMQSEKKYDAVDLDPYGTPSMLLDSAVQSVAEGGLLMVTATDMANLCGNNSTACWSNYGSYPVHRPYCHEMAVRILLASIENHANRYRRCITPLLSLSIDFYVRVFVRVTTSPAAVKDSPGKLAYLWQSSGCDSFWLQRVGSKKVHGTTTKYLPGHGPVVPEKCPETGSGYLMGGPIWAEPIHDPAFVRGVLADMERDKDRYAQYNRVRGLLTQAADELPDAPLYYDLHDVCKTVRCQPPKMELFRSALINAGYRVSASHANPLAVKTDAPSEVVWDIVRCWTKQHPVSGKKMEQNSYAFRLLSKEPKLQANFTRVAAAINPAKNDGITRYVQNPAHWGPKSRHGRPPVDHQASQQGKRKRQQGKGQGQQGGPGEGEKPQEEEGEGAEGEEAQEGQAEAGEAGQGKAEAEQQPQPQPGGADGEADTKKQRVA